VEHWSSYSCDGTEHKFFEQELLACAFVEGFADFLSMWIVGDRIANEPYGGDWGLENNWAFSDSLWVTNPVPGTDGLLVEGSVASFLYDLVDGATEKDSYTNTTGTDDDGFAVAASWLPDIIEYCKLNGANFNMSGPDQLVYCLEKSLAAQTIGSGLHSPSAWRSYSSVSWGVSLPVYDSLSIRSGWKYNMYGQ
ncbi:MAG: hypothetical protein ACREQV_02800, partial [Candidatus Binatia bacterium]